MNGKATSLFTCLIMSRPLKKIISVQRAQERKPPCRHPSTFTGLLQWHAQQPPLYQHPPGLYQYTLYSPIAQSYLACYMFGIH